MKQTANPKHQEVVVADVEAVVVSILEDAVDEETAAKFGEANHLVWTVPFVVFGLFRYLLLVQRKEGGPPRPRGPPGGLAATSGGKRPAAVGWTQRRSPANPTCDGALWRRPLVRGPSEKSQR